MIQLTRLKILDKIIPKVKYPSDNIIPQYSFIADISGTDSIAALIMIMEQTPHAIIIPSIIDLACEYGDKGQYQNVIIKIKEAFSNKKRIVLPTIISEANNLWKAIVSDDIHNTINSYGFYSPCIACHLVLHLIRIKIATHLKVRNVISGERESHSGKEKINQLDFVLDFYNSIYNAARIKHHLPLRHISESKSINKLLESKKCSSVRLNCLFAGNYYKRGTTELILDKTSVRSYVENYLTNLLKTFYKKVEVTNKVIDY